LAASSDEDKKSHERSASQIDALQQKIKTFKRQVEEAEEVAAINLAKYRKVQHDFEESEERADQAENAISRLRAKQRSSVSVSQTSGAGGSVTVKETRTESSESRRF